MVVEVLRVLGEASLALAAAIATVMLLRRPLRSLFGARAAYALWLAAPVAALAVLLPAPQRPAPILTHSDVVALATPVVPSGPPSPPSPAGPALARLAVGLWLSGVFLCLTVQAARQALFQRRIRPLRPSDDHLGLYLTAGEAGPAVVGVLRPRVIAPADFAHRFTREEQALVVAHERTHLASGDPLVNLLCLVLQAGFWFHPLVHLGARLMRIDQELACDAAVLAHRPESRGSYAAALLKMQLPAGAAPLSCHWPSRAGAQLRARLVLLRKQHGRARRGLGAAVAGLLVAAGGWAAWAAQPSTPTRAVVTPAPAAPAAAPFRPVSDPPKPAPSQVGLACFSNSCGAEPARTPVADDPAAAQSRLMAATATLRDATRVTQQARALYQGGGLTTTELLAQETAFLTAQLGLAEADLALNRASGASASLIAEDTALAEALKAKIAAGAEAAAKRDRDNQEAEAAARSAGAARGN